MLELYNNKYDRKTLKENIYAVKLMDILKTQTLDISFIVRYILSDLYQIHEDDKVISMYTVLSYQKHINKKELIKAIEMYNSDDDSVEDFETVSNKNSK
jgi:glycogen synthase